LTSQYNTKHDYDTATKTNGRRWFSRETSATHILRISTVKDCLFLKMSNKCQNTPNVFPYWSIRFVLSRRSFDIIFLYNTCLFTRIINHLQFTTEKQLFYARTSTVHGVHIQSYSFPVFVSRRVLQTNVVSHSTLQRF